MAQPASIPIESHDVHGRRLMEHAERELAEGDRLQASEKAWGAVAHRLKAIASRRGWKYDTHQQVYGIVERLANETREPQLLRDLFYVANGLHKNYYVDSVPLKDLEHQLSRVRALLNMLNRIEFGRSLREEGPGG